MQRAPALRTLSGAVSLGRAIDDATHAVWNDAGINALRIERAFGAQVAGARTLFHELPFRYVNVVRLVLTIKKACDIALRWTVFEPHDAELREQVRATLLSILRLFHARGAFAGDSEATSFYVAVRRDDQPAGRARCRPTDWPKSASPRRYPPSSSSCASGASLARRRSSCSRWRSRNERARPLRSARPERTAPR